jgi:hypothetical protein
VVAPLRGTGCYREACRGRERKKNILAERKTVKENRRDWKIEEEIQTDWNIKEEEGRKRKERKTRKRKKEVGRERNRDKERGREKGRGGKRRYRWWKRVDGREKIERVRENWKGWGTDTEY